MDLLRFLFGTSKRDQFAEQLLRRIKQAGETREIRYDREAFQFGFYEQGEPVGSANLANLFSEYDRLPAKHREAFLKRITNAILSHHVPLPENYEDARPDILPIVRNRAYLQIERLRHRLNGEPPPHVAHIDVGNHLIAMPIYDLPDAMRSLDPERIDKWGRSLYELMETAFENLEQIDAVVSTLDERVFLFRNQDNYDASRMLLSNRIGDLPVQGLPVAMVPTRDCLIITGDEDDIGMQMMADIGKRYLEDPRPISMTPCRLTGEGWQTWLPPRGHPVFAPLHDLHLQGIAGEFHEQRDAIETFFAQTGRRGFVANYFLFRELDTGELRSYCVWPECPYALLPRTDYVVFMDQQHMNPLASGTWRKVEQTLGSQVEDLETYPPRYRVLTFPSQEQLAEIGTISRFRL
ncbi:DUF1444 family protein [Blastopirellula marina]|uniref:DUF1444 domain-containing protein n=1 Tax=Blastopirellula marina TaxID=124 RepID=A0A2S8GPA5_9BACT|nr:DUF1444 family protein [Blastopirellula marina]PQO46260.1 hypothetical protein C5Y93_09750 [Blastopirellula marina]